jgi:hypothetical protein
MSGSSEKARPFGKTYRFHFKSKEQRVPQKPPSFQQGATTENTTIWKGRLNSENPSYYIQNTSASLVPPESFSTDIIRNFPPRLKRIQIWALKTSFYEKYLGLRNLIDKNAWCIAYVNGVVKGWCGKSSVIGDIHTNEVIDHNI